LALSPSWRDGDDGPIPMCKVDGDQAVNLHRSIGP
jgi:hypothetical protein